MNLFLPFSVLSIKDKLVLYKIHLNIIMMKINKSNPIQSLMNIKKYVVVGIFTLLLAIPQVVSAHCDSYDGPVIKDALKAFNENKVALVLKWIEPQHETEIKSLFEKTYALKNGDREIYQIVERHFLETLVRLHREGEGAPYTGLKPAGSTTAIVQMADKAL